MPNVTRMSDGQRRALQVGGIVLIVVGLGLFLSGPLRAMETFGPAGPGGMAGGQSSFFLTSVGGLILFALGTYAARFGFMKPVSELVATETGGALEHAGERVGTGFHRGGATTGGASGGTAREVIRIKCRSCGYLESEDARFCSGCGQAM